MLKRINVGEVLFVDTEATCWDNISRKEQQERRELIEVGMVKVDLKTNTIVDKENYLVKNQKSEISEYCYNLTGISQDLIDREGLYIGRAMKLINQRFAPKNKTWFTWGSFDYNFLLSESNKNNIEFIFNDNVINLADLYAMFKGLNRSKGLQKAINHLNVEVNGPKHRALPDAEATAGVFLKLKERINL